MNRQILLLGGGGHGRVVLDALLSANVHVAGILDPGLEAGDQVFGLPVLGGDGFLERIPATEALLFNGMGANPCLLGRKKLFEEMRTRGFKFGTVAHPSAVIGRECVLGEGVQIMAGAILQSRVRVGDNAVVNTRASIDHDCTLGRHAFISPGVVLSGGVRVKESAFIGVGAVVLPGIEIGANAIVGAGAVVTENVPDEWTVAGSPAARIGVNNKLGRF